MNLQAAREKSGKTQAQVAKEAGVSWRMYQSYEYGQNEPGVRTAIRIADALEVADLRELFGDDSAGHYTTAKGSEQSLQKD